MRHVASHQQEDYNAEMYAVTTSVELSYKDVRQQQTATDFKSMMKVREAHVENLFIESILLRSINVVLGHGSQTQGHMITDKTDVCTPPTWAEYVGDYTAPG